MTIRGIELKPVRNNEGIIMGFDLSAEPSTEDRFFIQTLPRNLATDKASFSFSDDSITIMNSADSRVFRLAPEEVAIIKEYIDTLGNGTQVEALRLKGFGSTIEFRFVNEEIAKRYS
jgi:hypothetical protein